MSQMRWDGKLWERLDGCGKNNISSTISSTISSPISSTTISSQTYMVDDIKSNKDSPKKLKIWKMEGFWKQEGLDEMGWWSFIHPIIHHQFISQSTISSIISSHNLPSILPHKWQQVSNQAMRDGRFVRDEMVIFNSSHQPSNNLINQPSHLISQSTISSVSQSTISSTIYHLTISLTINHLTIYHHHLIHIVSWFQAQFLWSFYLHCYHLLFLIDIFIRFWYDVIFFYVW